MKCRCGFAVVLLLLITGVLPAQPGADPGGGIGGGGVDAITFDAGQPTPNPGGAAGKISASGAYTLAPGHDMAAVSFTVSDGLPTSYASQAANNKWSNGPESPGAGTYDCQAQLSLNDGQKIWAINSGIVKGVVVK